MRNAALQIKSCVIQMKKEKEGTAYHTLTAKRRLEIMLNCHFGILSCIVTNLRNQNNILLNKRSTVSYRMATTVDEIVAAIQVI